MVDIEGRLKKARNRYEDLKKTNNKECITKNGQVVLREGTLLHGLGFDEAKLKSIAKSGLVGANYSNYRNVNSNARFPNGVNFFRVPTKCYMKQYFDWYSNTKVDSSGKRKRDKDFDYMRKIAEKEGLASNGGAMRRKEFDFLPSHLASNASVAFIINPSPEILSLRKDDPYLNGEEAFFSKGGYKGFDNMFKNIKSRVANVLYGIPPSQISGILVSKGIEINSEKIEFLKKNFPDMYITTIDGNVIYKGIDSREKNEVKSKTSELDRNLKIESVKLTPEQAEVKRKWIDKFIEAYDITETWGDKKVDNLKLYKDKMKEYVETGRNDEFYTLKNMFQKAKNKEQEVTPIQYSKNELKEMARLLKVAKNITTEDGKNYLEEFSNIQDINYVLLQMKKSDGMKELFEKAEEKKKKEVASKRSNKLDINSLKGSLENLGVTRSAVAVEIGKLSERARCHGQDIESVKKAGQSR